MNNVTISRSGTAWLQDMAAAGKVPTDGWASSPKAAYYASLDKGASTPMAPMAPSAPQLPATLEDLVKLQAQAQKDKKDELADQLQQQIRSAAAASGLPSTGLTLNETA